MNFHKLVSDYIINILDNFYYKNLIKIYSTVSTVSTTNNISDIFKDKYHIIKPEYFVYLQYYYIYLFLYYITYKNLIKYSVSLHLIYICGLIFDNLIIKYNYKVIYNISFLKDSSYLLFIYLFSFKLFFLKIKLYKRIIMLSSISIFYFLNGVNYIYTERLKHIEEKKDFIHPLKILIISPNKKFIEKVINKTKYFTYGNCLLFINLLIFVLNH